MKKIKLETLVTVGGAIVSIIALYFSWQANFLVHETNLLMREQMVGKPTIFRSTFFSYLFTRENMIECEYLFSIGNLGLSQTTITDFSTLISFRGRGIIITEGFVSSGSLSKSLTNQSIPPMTEYLAYLLPGTSGTVTEQDDQEIDLLNLPMTLEAGEIVDVRGHFTLYHNGSREDFENLTVNIASYDDYYQSKPEGFFPLEVTYRFFTTSEVGYIDSQALPCMYVRG